MNDTGELVHAPAMDKTKGKRDQILKAALSLFTSQGFHATPTAEISRTAGVSTGTLFHYFPDKQTLIDQLYLAIKREMSDILREDDDNAGSIKDQLTRGCIRYIRWAMENPEKAQFLTQFHHSPNISESIHTEAFEEFRWMEDLYLQAIREGVLDDLPVHYHMVMTVQILSGIIELISQEDMPLSPDEIITAGLHKLWR